MVDMYDKVMNEIFEQFEMVSQELEAENKSTTHELTLDEFLAIELDSKWFNRLVEDGLIELG